MARTAIHEIPSYRLHKPKGLAVVRLNGRDIYLGKYGTPESKASYDRVIAEWFANGKQLPPPSSHQPLPQSSVTVNDLILAFMQHAKAYYVKNGQPTGEIPNMKEALRPVAILYGTEPVTRFTPTAFTRTGMWGSRTAEARPLGATAKPQRRRPSLTVAIANAVRRSRAGWFASAMRC